MTSAAMSAIVGETTIRNNNSYSKICVCLFQFCIGVRNVQNFLIQFNTFYKNKTRKKKVNKENKPTLSYNFNDVLNFNDESAFRFKRDCRYKYIQRYVYVRKCNGICGLIKM